jgi:hypothetical protein
MEELFHFEKKSKYDFNVWSIVVRDNHTILILHIRKGKIEKSITVNTIVPINESFKNDIKEYINKYFEFIAQKFKNRISYAIATLIIVIYRKKYDTRRTMARFTYIVKITPEPSLTTIRTIYKQLNKLIMDEPKRVLQNIRV